MCTFSTQLISWIKKKLSTYVYWHISSMRELLLAYILFTSPDASSVFFKDTCFKCSHIYTLTVTTYSPAKRDQFHWPSKWPLSTRSHKYNSVFINTKHQTIIPRYSLRKYKNNKLFSLIVIYNTLYSFKKRQGIHFSI
jgi:hypothetical protein